MSLTFRTLVCGSVFYNWISKYYIYQAMFRRDDQLFNHIISIHFNLQTAFFFFPQYMYGNTCEHNLQDNISLSAVPFLTWCLAACGSSPHVQHWCPTRGSRLSGGNDRWAPDDPVLLQWSRSPVHLGSGFEPSEPTLKEKSERYLLITHIIWLI